MQFDESARRYRCMCDCCHAKTAVVLTAGAECLALFVLLVNALAMAADVRVDTDPSTGQQTVWNSTAALVLAPMWIGFGIMALALLVILLALLAVFKRSHYLLIPHIVCQIACICLLLAAVALAIIGAATHQAVFIRLLNAAPFYAPPPDAGRDTVALSTVQKARLYLIVALYVVLLLAELWCLRVVHTCYRYFKERRAYMNYCLEYCTPMKTVPTRMSQLSAR